MPARCWCFLAHIPRISLSGRGRLQLAFSPNKETVASRNGMPQKWSTWDGCTSAGARSDSSATMTGACGGRGYKRCVPVPGVPGHRPDPPVQVSVTCERNMDWCRKQKSTTVQVVIQTLNVVRQDLKTFCFLMMMTMLFSLFLSDKCDNSMTTSL